MGRLLTGLGGALGLAALWRFLRREQAQQQAEQRTQEAHPADELRAKLEQARGAVDDRDEFDAAEGQPVDEVEAPPLSLDERRRAIHEKAQHALGEMNRPDAQD